MKNFCFVAASMFFLFSCDSKEKKTPKEDEKEKAKKEFVIQRNKTIDTLVAKYNIKYKWDTLLYLYTAKYKAAINSEYQLIEKAYVTDLFEKDAITYVSILTSLFNFDLQITKEQEDDFIKGIDAGKDECVLVVSISDLKKIKFSIKGENDDEEVDIGISHRFIGHGKVIDIISLKN